VRLGVLRIDNEEVINNDGLHPDREKGGQTALKKGLHTFAIDFIEGGGGYRLDLKYSIGNESPKPVPAQWFKIKN
jgi:hexosaminidase